MQPSTEQSPAGKWLLAVVGGALAATAMAAAASSLYAVVRFGIESGGCAEGPGYTNANPCPDGFEWWVISMVVSPWLVLIGLAPVRRGFTASMPGRAALAVASGGLGLLSGSALVNWIDGPLEADRLAAAAVGAVAASGLVLLFYGRSTKRRVSVSSFVGFTGPGPITQYTGSGAMTQYTASGPMTHYTGPGTIAQSPDPAFVSELQSLADLYRRGELTAEEFVAAKARLIGG